MYNLLATKGFCPGLWRLEPLLTLSPFLTLGRFLTLTDFQGFNEPHSEPEMNQMENLRNTIECGLVLQGYLAQKKQPPSLGPQ